MGSPLHRSISLKIEVLGSACVSCERTALNVLRALAELNLHAEFEEVREPKRISSRPVSSTPAVLIDGVVACEGRVPTSEEIKSWLAQMKNWQA